MPNATRFPLTCSCCGDAIDADAWKALPLVGVADYGGVTLELRNHSCGSTLAIELTPAEARIAGARAAAAVAFGLSALEYRAQRQREAERVPSGRYSFVRDAYLARIAEPTARGWG